MEHSRGPGRAAVTGAEPAAEAPIDGDVGARPADREGGYTMAEMLVGLVIISFGLLALLDGIILAVHTQRERVQRAAAIRVATTASEDARRIPFSSLAALVGAPQTSTKTVNNTTYQTTTTETLCAVTDGAEACTTPGSGSPSAVRVKVDVKWTSGSKQHSVTVGTSVTDASQALLTGTGTGTISNLLGGSATSGTSVTLGNLTVSPTSVAVTSANNPTSAVTVTMTAVGLTATTSIPLTWTDDTGSHQTTMASAGNGTWSVSVPASSITKAPASGANTATVAFTATAPTGNGIQTANLTLVTQPTFTGCTVSPNPIVFQLLTTKLSAATTLTCTVKAVSSSDTVKVSYATPSSTQVSNLTTTDGGATWKIVLAAGTQLHSGLSTTFTFTATRASDSATATTTVNVLQA
ncbi:MAG TPA: type II secretion system protein [Mycobacteriales bacterium]|nr:type II secretion system protein [Mycobacteriales bacterium]